MAFDELHAQAIRQGNSARLRAAGMASLLVEVRAQNAARDIDPDLLDRIDRAIADHVRARGVAVQPDHTFSHQALMPGQAAPGGSNDAS